MGGCGPGGTANGASSQEDSPSNLPCPRFFACSHYSLAVLLRLLRGARRGDGFSASSSDAAADFRGRRGFLSSPVTRFRTLRGFRSLSESASSPVRGRSGIDSVKTGSGAGLEVSTTPTERRSGGTIPTRAPIGPRPRPRAGPPARAPMPVGAEGVTGAIGFGGSAAASCSLTEVEGAAGATS